jgi:hypothetical protein
MCRHLVSSNWFNAGIESVQTDPMQALSQFKLIQCRYWVSSNWPNAGIGSVQTDRMQALSQFKLIQCMHWVSSNWSNAGIGSVQTDRMQALSQFKLIFYPTRCVFSIPEPWRGVRKHTTSWIKIISHHKTWEILFITYLPPHTCFFLLYSWNGVA